MDLKIFFYRDEEAKEQLAFLSRSVGKGVKDGRRGVIHFSQDVWGVKDPFSDLVYMEAKLEQADSDEELDYRYQLQLAYRPDYEPQTNKEGRFFTWRRDKKGNQMPVFRMQMLRGASGVSILRLLRRTNMTEDFSWDAIAEFDIKVKPNPDKEYLLNYMVDEMLGVNPSAVLSKFEGLSKTNIKEEWLSSETASSLRDVERQIDSFEKVVTLLRPHLLGIVSRCTGIVVRTYQRINQERMHKISPRTRRDMDRRSFEGMSHRRVCAPVLSMSHDVPIHRAIKGFLLYFKNCVVGLISKLKESVTEDVNRLSEVPDTDKYLPKDITKEIEFKKSLLDKAEKILEKCRPLLAEGCPWMECIGGVDGTIDYLATVDIPDTEAYKCVHMLMMGFLKWRDFRGRLNGCFRLPKYVRDSEDGECSTWQKNYSFIYEAWVFKRLVQAFTNEGFNQLGTNYARQVESCIKKIHLGPVINDPIHSELKQKDCSLRVELYYGIIAYPDGTCNIKGFSTPRKRGRETPDYAIVFHDNDSGNQYWVVLDAKSCPKLDCKDVEKRDKYTKLVRLNGRNPDQTWIIYSGPKEGCPEIEFNPDELDQSKLPWSDGVKGKDPLGENYRVSFTRDGLSEYRNGPNVQHVGHVRANVCTIKERNVFAEFAKGQIAIAKKKLQIK